MPKKSTTCSTKFPKVFILIPTHNRSRLLKKCLDDIDSQTYPLIQTVVVDDGSTDDTQEILEKFPHVTTIYGNGNLWWTGATNLALKFALENAKPNDYVLLMNDDTEFEPTYIQTIVKDSKTHNRAIIGSVCFDTKNKAKPVETGVKCIWEKAGVIPLPFPTNAKQRKYNYNSDTFCGRGTLIPIEIVKEVGFFDGRLPHYGSDYEYFIRAKRLGAKLVFSYLAKVYRSARPGGIKFQTSLHKHLTLKQWYQILFSTRSRSNIIKDLHFTTMATPLKYKPKAYLRNISRLIDITSRLF